MANANFIESNEIARPYRGSKRRGKQPDKLCVKLFLLDQDTDVTTFNKELRSKNELERLKNIGCGPPEIKFLNKDNKVEFSISMTVEEFKKELVQIYPKLANKEFLLLKANGKSKGLERLNLAPSCYSPDDIYYSNVGRGKIYIQCVTELENFQTSTGEPSPSKRPRNMVTSASSSNAVVYRGIQPKPPTQSSTIAPSASNITCSISSTSSTLSVAPNNHVLQPISTASTAPSPGLFSTTLPTGITQSTSISTPTSLLSLSSFLPQQSVSGLNEAGSAGFSSGISSTATTPQIQGMLTSMQNYNNRNLTMPLSVVAENIISLITPQQLQQLQFQQQQLQNQQLQQQQPQQLQQQQQQNQQLQQQQQQQPQQQLQQQQQNQQLQQQQQQNQQLQQQLQQLQQQQQNQQLQQHQHQQPQQLQQQQQIQQLQQQQQQQPQQLQQQQQNQQLQQQQQQQPQQVQQQQQQQQQLQQQPVQHFAQQQLTFLPTSTNIESNSFGVRNFVSTVVGSRQNILSPPCSGTTVTTQSIPSTDLVNVIGGQRPVSVDLAMPGQQSVVSLPQSSHQPGPSYQFHHETLRDTSPMTFFTSGLSEIGRNIASTLSALADATVERGPINQEDELTSDGLDTDESTSAIPESSSISSPEDFDLDEFVKECQDTGHIEIFPNILKDRSLMERLQQPTVTIRSIAIHKQCKLSEVLKVFVLPVSLKVLTIKENCLDDDDIKSLVDVVIERNNLEELDLSNTLSLSNLRLMFISALVKLTSLKRLSLYNNHLVQQDVTLLGAILPSLASLEMLNLSKNYLSDEDSHTITSALSRLSSLKILELSGNKFCRTETVFNNLKSLKTLEKLDLSGNHGDNFSIDVQNIDQYALLSNLKVLSLSSNKMTPEDFSNLGPILFLCQSLEELFLDCNHIGNFIHTLCSLQRAAHRLKTLSLSGTKMGGSATEGLSCLLSKLQRLEVLDLSSNNLTGNDFQHLQPCLSKMLQLKVLNVSDNPGGSSMLEHILPFLTLLEELSARNTNLHEDKVKTISTVISSLKYLKRLDFSNNMIGSVGANALAEVLPLLPCLEKLDLSSADILEEAMHTMCVAINSLKHLKLLNLGGNKIGLNAVTTLADTVSLDMLEELDLNKCGLDGNGTKLLFDKCVSLMHLKRLVLSNNRLGIIGTSALALILPSMISLDELDLKKCSLDDKCLEDLGRAFLKGCSAGVLQSEGNMLSAKYFVSIKYLKKLDLSGNTIHSTGVAALAEVLPTLELLEKLMLTSVYFDYDDIEFFFAAMVSLKYLKKLDLNFNGYYTSAACVAALAGVLPSLQLLEELALYYFDCDDHSDDDCIVAKLCAAMVSLKYLRKLHLIFDCCCCSTGVAAVVGVLQSLQLLELTFHCLHYENCNIAKLYAAMVSLKYLKKLDLRVIYYAGVAGLSGVLPSLQLLEELTLQTDRKDHSDGECSVSKLCAEMVSLKYLKKLDLTVCLRSVATLAGVLPSLQLLEELRFYGSECGSPIDDVAKLCAAMVSLKYLRKLHLTQMINHCTDDAALAGVLPSLQLLEELTLDSLCCCDDDNCDADSCDCDSDKCNVAKLCAAMVSLKYLRKLHLAREWYFCSLAVAALAGVFPSLQLLEELRLHGFDCDDNIDDDCDIAKLCAAMVSLKYLKKLDFNDMQSRCCTPGVAALAGVLPSLPFLKKLNLGKCRLNKTDEEKLRSKIRPGIELKMST